MAHMTINFKSAALNMPVMLDVLLPRQCKDCKTLYLLHGYGGDRESWLLGSRVAEYVEDRQIAVVMPSGNNKFFLNNVHGKAYQTFVAEELPARMEAWFGVSKKPEHRFIAGADMGGFGALYAAAEKPDRYGAAFSYHDFSYMKAQCEALEAGTARTVFGLEAAGAGMVQKLEEKVALAQKAGAADFIICDKKDNEDRKYLDRCLQKTIDYIMSEGSKSWQ